MVSQRVGPSKMDPRFRSLRKRMEPGKSCVMAALTRASFGLASKQGLPCHLTRCCRISVP